MKRGKGRDKYAEVDEFERKARKNKKSRRSDESDQYESSHGRINPHDFLDEEEEFYGELERLDRN